MGSSTYFGAGHLDFRKLPLEKGQKLHKYRVYNHTLWEIIGIIHWRGGWRQYVFTAITHFKNDIVEIGGKKYLPVNRILEVDMSKGCHQKIDKFIDKLMEEWREAHKKT